MSNLARTSLVAVLLAASCTDLPAFPSLAADGGGAGADGGAPPEQVVVANAGSDQIVAPGATVFLDGRASFATGGDTVDVVWSLADGPPVTLSDPSAPLTRFTAPLSQGALVFLLTATDGSLTATDHVRVLVRVSGGDRAPFAVAGPDVSAAPGATVHLDASASVDPDGDPLTYTWRGPGGRTLSTGPTAVLVAPTGMGPAPVPVPVRLEVSDGTLTARDDLLVEVADPAIPDHPPVPTVTAPSSAAPGAQVVLDATATDPESDPVDLGWRQIAGPRLNLTQTGAHASFTAPRRVVDLGFELLSTDGFLAGAPVPVAISVTAGPGNHAPLANAGTDLTVASGATVTLDGTGSSDPDGQPLTYTWTQLAGPAVTLASPHAATTTFAAPAGPATLTFSLVVSDGMVASAPSLVQVTVQP